MRHCLIYLFFGLACFSCRKDGIIYKPKRPVVIDISGIAEKDINANPLGGEDKTDWQTDTILPDTVIHLFNTRLTEVDYSFLADVYQISQPVFFPNPLVNNATFRFEVSDACGLKYFIVNAQLEVLVESFVKLPKGRHNIAFNLSALPPNFYRLYYGFYNNNGKIYRAGWGDLLKQ